MDRARPFVTAFTTSGESDQHALSGIGTATPSRSSMLRPPFFLFDLRHVKHEQCTQAHREQHANHRGSKSPRKNLHGATPISTLSVRPRGKNAVSPFAKVTRTRARATPVVAALSCASVGFARTIPPAASVIVSGNEPPEKRSQSRTQVAFVRSCALPSVVIATSAKSASPPLSHSKSATRNHRLSRHKSHACSTSNLRRVCFACNVVNRHSMDARAKLRAIPCARDARWLCDRHVARCSVH